MSLMEDLGMDGDFKEEAVGMMDKEELEELLGLQVQFRETASSLPVVPCSDGARKKHGRKARHLAGKKFSTPGQHAQVDIGEEAFRMWSSIGLAQGLSSDPEIATFLLQHYENTKHSLFPSSNCTVCSQPLSLFCSQCKQPMPLLPFSATPGAEASVNIGMSTAEVPSEVTQKVTPEGVGEVTIKSEQKALDVSSAAESVTYADGSYDDDDGKDDDGVVDVEDAGDEEQNDRNVGVKVEGKEEQPDDDAASFTHITPQPTAENMEEEEGKFSCVMCSRSYTRACSLKAHMRKHTGEKPFKCKRCDAAFSLSGSLVVHQRTHTGDKPYVCEECGQRFSISNALKQHRRQHTGEKPYHCQICFSKYSRSDSLKVHMRTHSGDRPFICEICGADFSRLYCLIAHKKKHSGERPFKCSECPATFVQSGKLTIHMRKHTGDRPFQCEQCGASFTQSERLKTHLRIHSGEKPYKCQDCGKGFSHPHSLKVHGRVHTGDKPYKCDVCSLTFADPSYFRRHKAKHVSTVEPSDGVTPDVCGPHPISSYLNATPSNGFAVPLSGVDGLSTLQTADISLPSTAPAMVTTSFLEANNVATETLGSPDCFPKTAAGFPMPLPSSVPSVGFSAPSSSSQGFVVPSVMNVIADGADTSSAVGAADPFAFLRTALHCPGSFPS